MQTVRHLVAAVLFTATASASAGPVAINDFSFNNNLTDKGSKALTMYANGAVSYADTAPVAAGGKAVNFNGFGSVKANGVMKTIGDFSIAFWMKTGVASNSGGSQWYQGNGLVDAETSGMTSDWGISLLNNKIAFGIGGDQFDKTVSSTKTVTDNQWHLVSATWAMSTGTMSLYLDGVLDNTGIGQAGYRYGQNALTLGAIAVNNNYYNGSLAHVQVFDSVLTAKDVAAIYAPKAVPEPGSVALMGLGLAGLLARRRKAGKPQA